MLKKVPEVSSPIYCSIDLEFSGFDPSKASILEVGLSFFAFKKGKLVITEEWTSVFKPTGPVPPNILGLTGITLEELENAPSFGEHREFLTQKLQGAILVGHNLTLDVKFLEANGVTLSGKTVDTLELVQIFMPTHHSYNLENLMHYYSISHKNAHRALADSRAGAYLLEKLLGLYQSFPVGLQQQISKEAKKARFLWADLLDVELASKRQNVSDVSKKIILPLKADTFGQDVLVSLPFSSDLESSGLSSAFSSKLKSVLVLPDKKQVLKCLEQKGTTGLFSPEDSFDERAFVKLLKMRNKTREQVQFLLKVMVWRVTNNQTDTVRDMNVNFFGGQFIPLVTRTKKTAPEGKHIVCDYQTFFLYASSKEFKDRKVVLLDIDIFERMVSKTVGTKVSWNQILYILKSIYNPETDFGEQKFKKLVIDALTATDLFFALFSLYLKPTGEDVQAVGVAELDEYFYEKVNKAANNFISKMEKIANILRSKALKECLYNVKMFFVSSTATVRWVEFGENYCALYSRPVEIASKVSRVLSGFSDVVILDKGLNTEIIEYYKVRLGLERLLAVVPYSDNVLRKKIRIGNKKQALEELLASPLPVAMLFGTPGAVKRFYDEHYSTLKSRGNLLAQNVTGGSTKLFRNFGIRKESIMLATSEFVAKNSWAQVTVETLLFLGIKDKRFVHPYEEAVTNNLKHVGIHFQEVQRKNIQRLVYRTFYSKNLKKIIVFPE